MKTILPADLVALDDYAGTHPVRIGLVYADAQHPDNMFRTAIYRADARAWAFRPLAEVILLASRICHDNTGWYFAIRDCLRPVEAQEKMRETNIVRANPHWLEEPNRLLSPPGKGGHPRAMAVDIVLVMEDGTEIDMGTSFDYLTPDPARNPAARSWRDFGSAARNNEILANRMVLEESMMQAAAILKTPLLPLPQEWWDFRFPKEVYELYAPLSDAELPEEYRMTDL